MKDISLHEYMDMPDYSFPIKLLHSYSSGKGSKLPKHWHEQIELLLFRNGKAAVQCDKNSFQATKGTLVVVNCNDIHSLESMSNSLHYDCIIFDLLLMRSAFMDNTQVKYITPIIQNSILFKNEIKGNSDVLRCVENIIEECKQKQFGYELAIKGEVFKLFSLLTRKYVDRILTPQESDMRIRTLERFKAVFEFVEKSYYENITIEEISAAANLSPYYFCHLFKDIMGRSFIDYLNSFRIDKAEQLLLETDMNITETAIACGYNDINYFSRLFKRYKNMSPSYIRHNKPI